MSKAVMVLQNPNSFVYHSLLNTVHISEYVRITESVMICNKYRMVGRSINNISDPRCHFYRGAIFTEVCSAEVSIYAAEVGYRDYVDQPTIRYMINRMVSVQQTNTFA